MGLGRQRRPVQPVPPARALGDPQNPLDTFILGLPVPALRSALIGIAVHSAQDRVISALVLALVLSCNRSLRQH
jgi:hypothetical protein